MPSASAVSSSVKPQKEAQLNHFAMQPRSSSVLDTERLQSIGSPAIKRRAIRCSS
jgi:hypothetical protein